MSRALHIKRNMLVELANFSPDHTLIIIIKRKNKIKKTFKFCSDAFVRRAIFFNLQGGKIDIGGFARQAMKRCKSENVNNNIQECF